MIHPAIQAAEIRAFANFSNEKKPALFNLNIKQTASSWTKNIFVIGTKNLDLVWISLKFLVVKSVVRLALKISEFVRRVFNCTKRCDKHKLVNTHYPQELSKQAWTLNNALLSEVDNIARPETKEMIRFLRTNYMVKAAPQKFDFLNWIVPDLDDKFQIAETNLDGDYFRSSNPYYKTDVLVRSNDPVILTDTKDFAHFIPLFFTHLDQSNRKDWASIICKELYKELEGAEDKRAALNNFKTQFCFDLTEYLSGHIYKKVGKKFEPEFEKLKGEINEIIDLISEDLAEGFPELNSSEIKAALRSQSLAICRFDGDLTGVKILKLFPRQLSNHAIYDLFKFTGLKIGIINYRRTSPENFGANIHSEYSVKKGALDSVYFPYPIDFTNSDLFSRLQSKWMTYDEEKPYIHILGFTTLCLLKGLMLDTPSEKWAQAMAHDDTRALLQLTLFKIHQALANAEINDDFHKFATEIELLHCEITVLFELLKPYDDRSFSELAKEKWEGVPGPLKPHVKAGLGKTSMNVAASVLSAIRKEGSLSVAYQQSVYYEQPQMFGSQKELEVVLKDEKTEKVDVLFCMFHPNVDIEPERTHYKVEDVSGNIRRVLAAKPKTEHLTVALDVTFNTQNCERVQALLAEYQDEILSGKLNFLIYRSGQKYDLLGMDNYYGSPYFLVNNGASDWQGINDISNDPAIKTDRLTHNWFYLSTKYALKGIELYKREVFKNAHKMLQLIPSVLMPKNEGVAQFARVSTVDPDVNLSFVDIKILGKMHNARSWAHVLNMYKIFSENGLITHRRASIGFFYANFNIIPDHPGSTTFRINPGLNPADVPVMGKFFESLSDSA